METVDGEQAEDAVVGRQHQGGAAHAVTLRMAAAACLGGALLIVAAVGLVLVGDLRSGARMAVGLLLLSGVGYALVCTTLARAWNRIDAAGRRRAVVGVVALATLLRVALLAVPPSLSDDIYRYRWDGRVQAAGLNPYSEPPGSSRLEALRDPLWQLINYPNIRTIYPPLTQILFALTYQMHDSLLAFQIAAALGDALVILMLWLLLRAWRRPGWQLALYALHPLPAIEFASSGHFDGWTMGIVLAAILAHTRGRHAASTILLGAGILMKTWPVVLVPLLLRRRGWRHAALLIGVIVGGYLPFLDPGIIQPWLDYAGRWRFNDGAFYLLTWAAGSTAAAKGLAATLGVGLFGWLWYRDADPVRGGYWLLAAFTLLMPTVHPWYMLWALPLAAASLDVGWIALCLLAPTAYWILVGAGGDSNVWIEPWWPRLVQYGPAALLWSWQTWRSGAPAPGPRALPAATDAAVPDG